MKRSVTNSVGLYQFLILLFCVSLATPVSGQTIAENLNIANSSSQIQSAALQKAGKMVLLKAALKKIERTYHVTFLYDSELIEGEMVPASVLQTDSLGTMLARILAKRNLTYEQGTNHTYVIVKKTGESASKSESKVKAETVRGSVKSASTGESLPGVNIIVKGTTTGTATDLQGLYELSVPTLSDTLVFSYLGYQTQEIPINGRTTIDVTLQEQQIQGEELVVVGYGTQSKRDVTGSVSKISSDDLNPGTVTNPLEQLSGRAAGVNITQIGSEPGVAPTIRIRGISSLIGGNDPLVVVDGIQGNLDLLNQIPPSEIESVDILKDASATAIYGSRGAPGVILITTKKNRGDKVTVEYNGNTSYDFLSNKLDLLSASQWRQQAEQWGVPYSADHGSDTDWYGILTRGGVTQNHTLSIGGGSGSFSYRASLSAILQEGVVINSKNNNYIARIEATQKALDDRLTFTVHLNNSVRKNVGSPGSVGRAAFTSNLISNAYVSKPTDPVYSSDGSYFFDPNVFQYINPYAVAETIVNESENHDQFGSLRTDLEIIDGLSVGWFGSWRKVDNNNGYYAPSKSTLPYAIDHNGAANVSTNMTDEKLMDISLNFDKSVGRHKVSGVAVYEWQSQLYQGHYVQAKGFINDIATYNALQLGSIDEVTPGDMSSYKNDRKLISFLGRVNYSFADKYLVTASVRRDGSSVFGANHKWGTFPSVSLAWRLSDESFMQGLKVLNTLKLRAGYGITGNQQGLYPQQSLQLVGASGTTYFNGGLITNFEVIQNANKDLQWETRKQANIGLDFGLFGKLYGSVDVYHAKTDNLLFNYTVPQPPYPYGSIVANVGSLQNEGIDAELNYLAVSSGDLNVKLGVSLSLMRNKVLSLDGNLNGVPLNTNYVPMGYNAYLVEGQPIGSFYILHHTGMDENHSETVEDRNGDGVIDQGNRSEDRYFAGSALPTYTFGFNPSVKYKNWDFSMSWIGSGGNKIYNSIKSSFSYFENLGKSNLLESAVSTGLYTSKYGSDLWLEDGDYIRLNNVTLGYTFNTDKIGLAKSLRVSVTGKNLLLITDYTGLDPEINMSGGDGSGADAGIYPRTSSVSVGLHVAF